MATDNDITSLRGHLFDTIRALKDKDAPMEIDRAKAIADVAGKIIDSAKVENDFMKIAGQSASGFIPQPALTGPQGGDGTVKQGAPAPRGYIQRGLVK